MNKQKKLVYPAPLKYTQEIFHVRVEDLARLRAKYNVSEKCLDESVDLIQDWYYKQPHFPHIEYERSAIVRLLIANKFSIERSKEKLENFLTMKSVIPEFFGIRDTQDERIQKSLNMLEWVIFPQPTPDDSRIIYTKINDSNPENFDPLCMYTTAFLLAEMRLCVDAVCGDVFIWDFVNASFGHVTKVPPMLVKKAAYVMQHCCGQSIRGIHFLNLPPYAVTIFNLLKSLHSKKISERIYIHSSLDTLYEHIPRSFFPADMGGDERKSSKEIADTFRDVMKSPEWRQWFIDTGKIRVDESRRPKATQNIITESSEIAGSFRMLDID